MHVCTMYICVCMYLYLFVCVYRYLNFQKKCPNFTDISIAGMIQWATESHIFSFPASSSKIWLKRELLKW